jgi:hypothetical protein
MVGTPFDAIKALREEIRGLLEVRTTFINMERRAQNKLGEAENEHNDAVKARGFVDSEIARKREVLRAEEEKNQ